MGEGEEGEGSYRGLETAGRQGMAAEESRERGGGAVARKQLAAAQPRPLHFLLQL